MSLINQMLRDLETRRADGSEKLNLPNEVRPLPAEAGNGRWLKPVLAMLAGCMAVAAIGWAVVELTLAPQIEATAVPPSPAHQKSALKLDADLTVAHVRPVPPTLPRQTSPANRPEIPPHPAAIPAIEQDGGAGARIEKRAPSPNNNGSPTQRAREQLTAGQSNQAEATLKQALAENPAHVAARQMLFGLMVEERRGDDALALLKEGLVLHPEQILWASNAARLQMDRNDAAGAWETLERSLPAAANQGEYRAFCGTVLSRLKRYGDAIQHYQAALRINPDEGRWWVGMALALEADGKLPESREAFARAQASGKLPPELAAYVDSKLKQ